MKNRFGTQFGKLKRAYSSLGLALAVALTLSVALGACTSGNAQKPLNFKLATSIYVGWMPWMYAAEKGYLKQEAAARGMEIGLVRGDYADTIDQFIRGDVDAVTITNVDALSALAASGVTADVVLVGSFSNGNDAILVNAQAPATLAGAKLALVENSVSQYLLDRYLESQKIDGKSVTVFPASDSELAKKLADAGDGLTGVVTWQPIVGEIEGRLKTRRLTDSSKFPKEIADLLVVRRTVLKAHPEFAQALLHTWFKVMQDMQGAAKAKTIEQIAKLSGDTPASYQAQLDTTILLGDPAAALATLADPAVVEKMTRIEKFTRDRNLIPKVPVNTKLVALQAEEVAMRFNTEPLQAFGGQR
jgi:NitT/TauT family transport system substrate-binding protein